MINIQEEMKVLLFRQGLSMNKLVKRMKESGIDMFTSASLSRGLKDKSIKFERVQQILDFLGYEIEIKKKT